MWALIALAWGVAGWDCGFVVDSLRGAGVGDQRVLITGGAGKVGRMLRARMSGWSLRLVDVVAPEPAGPGEDAETRTGSVTDAALMRDACAGVGAVVHLGGVSAENTWSSILDVNIDGTRTVLEAARLAGVTRVVLASSNHAVGFRTRDEGMPLPADVPIRPDTYYGVSKAAMEALGSLYHDRYGMDVICLRIGTMDDRPENARGLATWLSPDDGTRLVEACLNAPSPGFRIVWGVSRNTRRWWSLAEGEELGYRPRDDAEAYAPEILAGSEPDPAAPVHHRAGGGFCDAPLGEPM